MRILRSARRSALHRALLADIGIVLCMSAVIALAFTSGVVVGGPEPQPSPPSKPLPDPPTEDGVPPDFPPNAIRVFGDSSWRMFIALNWPAAADTRGVPNREKSFGDVSKPVVWETWKAAHELFLPEGADPPGWDEVATRGLQDKVVGAERG